MSKDADVTLVALALPRGRQAWTFRHQGRSYSVFNVDGELQVTDAACPHHGGPLAEGLIRDGVVTCPWHWYSFELRSGECRTSAGYRLRKYPVVSRDGRLYAELPADPVSAWLFPRHSLRKLPARFRRRSGAPGGGA
ncbi:MAG TPA: Rieske 2Fe-2S domain-containing protein [Streptosporangiaceae bacterium]|nr:Rieske 2Fe-2S domain-containing protein [Streptosporangiaceae bacterium]